MMQCKDESAVKRVVQTQKQFRHSRLTYVSVAGSKGSSYSLDCLTAS